MVNSNNFRIFASEVKIDKMNKLLLVIDCQYDFINGSLAVKGAGPTMDRLAEFIKENGASYKKIVLTADWHPLTHCSFKDNGGTWPKHCVQHTQGAAIYQPIIDTLDTIKSDYTVLTKGKIEDHEEYSIFKNNISKNIIVNTCNTLEITDIDVVGIAYDYCVACSVKDGMRHFPNVNFHIYKDLCPYIAQDTADNFTNYIKSTERVCLV